MGIDLDEASIAVLRALHDSGDDHAPTAEELAATIRDGGSAPKGWAVFGDAVEHVLFELERGGLVRQTDDEAASFGSAGFAERRWQLTDDGRDAATLER